MRHTPASLFFHVLAVVWLGMMAGFFCAYSFNVNFATLQMDGATYAVVQSMLNRNVRHSLFFVFFFLAPLWCVLAVTLDWQRRVWCLLLVAAALLYVGGIIFLTREVNLPLNAYTESWNPGALPSDWEHTRGAWNQANMWRSAASATAFVLSVLALVLRAPGRPPRAG
ncbi:MAG: DUF1772 domain-containing protein [Polaromonas sp.]|uniref:DUF1772 domain-containing protein n=1 Tax=Polaromonas sp. TaxID=1869339 RepID=UPI0017F6F369|nr:DUF1772 domain-containing protein [Polaromonas sp.]MBA3595745.1 DUF1772 domain-containing protein [Polaromonas sp.]